MKDVLNGIKKNKKAIVLYRAVRYFNSESYVNKVYNINTLNIHLGNIRETGDIFYNIEIKNNNSGFFAHIYWVLNGLYIADRLGFVPYICIKGSKYNESNDPDDNMYEHYFVQDRKKEQNSSYIDYEISLSSYICKEFKMDGYAVSEEYIDEMAGIYNKYMELKPEIKKRIYEEVELLIKEPSTTLAVHSRGTAYSVGFYGHPVQAIFSDYQKHIDCALKNGFNSIFLATDDNTIKEEFKKKYGQKVIYFDDVLRSSNSLDIIDLHDQRKDNAFLMGYEVLRDAMAMAYCDGFVAGFSKVSMYTRILKKASGKEFKYLKIIDNGIVEKKNFISEQKYKIKKNIYEKKR